MVAPLSPVDPRSLMQGDYMDLRYEIARKLPESIPRVEKIVLRLDGNQVGHFVSLDPQKPLGPNQILLRYLRRGKSIHLGAALFFRGKRGQDGSAWSTPRWIRF